LVSILLISPILNLIPLASLASILIVTGYKLVRVSLFVSMYKKGMNQFIPFVATIISIMLTDLLVGVMIGLAVSIFYLLKSNFRNPFTLEKAKVNIGETVRIELPNQVSFLNKASIKDTLWSLPDGTKVIIDATYSDYVENDVLEVIEDFKNTVSVNKNIKLNILGLKERYSLDDHIQFINVLDKETQQKLRPDEILNLLRTGNERFVKGRWTEKYFKHQLNATSFGQNPMAAVVTCIDSRTSPEIIFDVGLGDIISIRIAGNIMSHEIIGSIELACMEIGTKVVVVMGHGSCGAVATAIHGLDHGHIPDVTRKIEKAMRDCNCTKATFKADPSLFTKVIKANVANSITEMLYESPYLSQKVSTREILVVPAYYDIATGMVSFGDEANVRRVATS
jgi:carbonic anhydrase